MKTVRRLVWPKSAPARTLTITLALHVAFWILLVAAYRDVGWAASWAVTCMGSALLITGAAAAIDVVALQFGGLVRLVVRMLGTLGFGLGWVFGVAGGALVAFHPVMLIYIVFFGGCGLVLGVMAGVLLGCLCELLDWMLFRRRASAP